MEFNKPEVAALKAAEVQVTEIVKELNELELTLVGGGSGDIHLG